MKFDPLSQEISGCAIEVHRHLGPGLLALTYRRCLVLEVTASGIHCAQDRGLQAAYQGVHLDGGYRIDLLVEDQPIVERKAVEKIAGIHEAQILT